MRRELVALLALGVLSVGCGTTVPQRGMATGTDQLGGVGPAAGGGNPTSEFVPSSPGSGGSATGAGGSAGGSAATGTTGSNNAGRPSAGSVTSSTGATSTGTGGSAGVLTTPIKVGIVTTKSTSAAAGSLGFQGADNGDELAVLKAAISSINAHGGVGGRRLDRVSFEIDPSRDAGKSEADFAAAMCSTFTEDNHVEVVLYRAFFPGLAACLEKKGIPYLISAAAQAPTEAQLRGLPQIAALGPSVDRKAKAYADDLAAQGFFRDSKGGLGLVIEDRPEIRQVATTVLLPELTRLGVNVDAVYGPPASDTSGVGRAMGAAVLRWNGSRDRVMFFTTYSIFALTFMQQAEAQQYHPKYGLDSSSTPQILAANLSKTKQLHGAVGLGVDPNYDADPASWKVQPPGRGSCLKLVRTTSQTPAAGSVEEAADLENCDLVFLLKAAGDRLVTSKVSAQQDRIISGVEGLGSGFLAANIQRTRFAPGVRAGGSHYQRFAYDDACVCFRYTTLPLPF